MVAWQADMRGAVGLQVHGGDVARFTAVSVWKTTKTRGRGSSLEEREAGRMSLRPAISNAAGRMCTEFSQSVKYLMNHQPLADFCRTSTTEPMATVISSSLVAL